MPRVAKLGHIVLYAQDVPRLTAFYEDVLGLTVSARDKTNHVAFLGIDPHANHHDLGFVSNRGAAHIAFYVDSLAEFRQFHAELKARKITVHLCQLVVFGLMMQFRDPEGNVAEVAWPHGKWGSFPFHRRVDLDAMTDADILRIVDEMPLESPEEGGR